MGRTWKDTIDSPEDFFKENSQTKHDFLNSFYNSHQWLIDRLIEKGVNVDLLSNRERLRFKYGNWEQNYYPLSGEHTMPGNERLKIIETQEVVVPNKYFNEEWAKQKKIEVFPKKPQKKIKLKNQPTERKIVTGKKSYSKYTNFVEFTERFVERTNIKPDLETYYAKDLEKEESEIVQVQPIILDINQEIINYLNKHPNFIYDISSRKFEELIAHILKRFGFDVELTKATRDGGRDILAYIKNSVCSYLTFVECKHFSPDNPVGVGIVRSVYGVQQIHRANKSLIVTSSHFTKDAIELTKPIANELELKDHNDIKIWLNHLS